MKIVIDGDACPVKEEIYELSEAFDLEVLVVSNYAHFSTKTLPSHVSLKYVDMGSDQADFIIFSMIEEGDLLVTQDYGLAALVLNKCDVMHHEGYFYSSDTIENLLLLRHLNQQSRKTGERIRGPRAFTQDDRKKFKAQLLNYLRQ